MKKACFGFLLLLFYGCSSQAQPKTPDEMIHAIFAFIKSKDEKSFMALCPDSIQLERIGKKFAENIRGKIEEERKAWQQRSKGYPQASSASFAKTDSALAVALRENYSPKGIKAAQERYRNAFRFMLEKGERKGINWGEIKFINYILDSANKSQQRPRFFLGQSGYQSVSGVIYFKAGNEAFKMSFGDVLFLSEENGWYGAVLDRIVREGEAIESDHEGEVTTEINVSESVDEPPPPPPTKKARSKNHSRQNKEHR